MTLHRLRQDQRAGHTTGETFGRAAEFLTLIAAKAAPCTDNSAYLAHLKAP
jgi:hypothetical protein